MSSKSVDLRGDKSRKKIRQTDLCVCDDSLSDYKLEEIKKRENFMPSCVAS